jgi:hypothetical protein
VTRLPHRCPLTFKGLRGFSLTRSKIASDNQIKIPVKFLKKTSRGTLVECGKKVTTVRRVLKRIPVGEYSVQGHRTVASEAPMGGAEARYKIL